MAKGLKNVLIYCIHDKQLFDYAERNLTGNLIDIGCGEKPYKEILAPFVAEHVVVDHETTFHDKSNVIYFDQHMKYRSIVRPSIQQFVPLCWSTWKNQNKRHGNATKL